MGPRQRDRPGPSVPSPRILLPGRRAERLAAAGPRLEGHRQRAAEGASPDCVATGRSSGRVDVPLPHPRAPCDGDDGALRAPPCRPLKSGYRATSGWRSRTKSAISAAGTTIRNPTAIPVLQSDRLLKLTETDVEHAGDGRSPSSAYAQE